ncbi:MAG TPA: ATP-binding protein [Clostridia bacterium]|nr:ATP-binding protein [Clostridia bacterium]
MQEEPTPTTAATDVCLTCSGSGWKMVAALDQAGREVQKAVRCDCHLRARGLRLLEQARIPKRYEQCELSNFDFEGPHRSLAPARMASYRFVEEFPMERAGLLLIGPIGAGKTHLAVGIVKELISQKGIPCLFYDYRELLKAIQNSYNSTVQTTEMEILRPIFEAEVLVLDELGAVKPTEWVWDTVSHILNTRYNDKRTTIITTNYQDLPPGGAADEGRSYSAAARAAREETLGDRIGERMRSRLHEMCRIIRVEGDDYRMKLKSASFR